MILPLICITIFHIRFLLNKVALTFKSVDETLVCDHSNESYSTLFFCGTFDFFVQSVLKFYPSRLTVLPFKRCFFFKGFNPCAKELPVFNFNAL